MIPGQLYSYLNTNFTILQALMDAVCQRRQQGEYLQWVRTAILTPLGIDSTVFSSSPDDPTAATLTSTTSTDPTGHGTYWPMMQSVVQVGGCPRPDR